MKKASTELKIPFLFKKYGDEQAELQTPFAYRAPTFSGEQNQGLCACKNCDTELATHLPPPEFPHGGCVALQDRSPKCPVRWQPDGSHVQVLQLPTGGNASLMKEKENSKNNYRSLLGFWCWKDPIEISHPTVPKGGKTLIVKIHDLRAW